MKYVKGYGLLAGYCGVTQLAGVNYWEIAPLSRPLWLVGALAVLVLALGRRQPT